MACWLWRCLLWASWRGALTFTACWAIQGLLAREGHHVELVPVASIAACAIGAILPWTWR